MKISYQWLREWTDSKLDAQALAERLTQAGIEVGAIEPVAPTLDKVVVGQVIEVRTHPAADRLKLCKVRTGGRDVLDIVCGADNVVPGMKAPVALVGARLPNGTEIRETEIRGARSQGMLCSAAELGLEETSAGLLDLGAEAKVGLPLGQALGLDDVTLEVELTPNRGDCLSVAGLGREVAAVTGASLRAPRIAAVRATARRTLPVVVEAPADCPHYAGRVVEDIDPTTVTPLWMKERLRRSGIRSIHPVVDVTNYVMIELGQPMHAFDVARLQGGIHVRRSRAGERLTLLDGKPLDLAADSLVIADQARVLALAGIMGGQDSGVDKTTRTVFFESAFFRPEVISGRARTLGLQTESSYRFERGVDPGLQRAAVERATRLLIDIAGGKPGPVIEKTSRRHLRRPPGIRLRSARIERVLGAPLTVREVEKILGRLGMKLRRERTGWRVVGPGHRFDITREEDLIEELARVHGYDKLPSRLPTISMPTAPVSETRISESRLRTLLVDRGYQEVVTYSFVDPAVNALVDPKRQPARLMNPISADMAVMRTSLWPGLLSVLIYNLNRQQTRVRVFEIGRCFVPDGKDVRQDKRLGGLICGPVMAKQWGASSRLADYFDAKSDIEGLVALTGRLDRLEVGAGVHPALHPGQSAELRLDGQVVGWVGRMHPGAQARLDIEPPVLLFELGLEALMQAEVPSFREISKFPSILRDISLILPEETPASSVIDITRKVAGNLLVNLELFDQYRGEGIDSGRKSLAMGLTLQDSSRTLKEEEVEGVIQRIVSTLEAKLGARLRH